jgi:RNA polymerase primary sigma factor
MNSESQGLRERSRELAVDGDAMGYYLNSLKKHQQLNHEQMVELFKQLEEGGPIASKARNKLVETNLRLVVYVAKQYKRHNMPLEDIIQEGNLGLMKAIEKFDWRRGFRFSTYATWWVRQAIGQHILKRKRIIRMSAHAVNTQKKLMSAAEEYRSTMGCEPSVEELKELTGTSDMIFNATTISGRAIISLDQPLSSDPDSDTLEDKIGADLSEDPMQIVSSKELLSVAKEVMQQLSPKEAAILRLRFGLVEDVSADDSYNLTQEEVVAIAKGHGLT